VSVIGGNGILYQRSAPFGGEHVVAEVFYHEPFALYDEETGEGDYDTAKALCAKVNLFGLDEGEIEVPTGNFGRKAVSVTELREVIKRSLDELCEQIERYFEECPEKQYCSTRPLLLTGGGLASIRGVREHMSRQLGREVEIIAPDLPYYSTQSQSSLLGLLDMAINDKQKGSMVSKILSGLAGA
ncbi:MAG: hypothetical protein ACI4U2_06115, partial [Christensenellaceae bacterium]